MNDGIFHERLAYQKPVLLNIYLYIYIIYILYIYMRINMLNIYIYIYIHIYIAYLYSIFIPHIQLVLKIKWMSF